MDRISKHSDLETVHFTWDGTTLCEQTTENVVLTWDHAGLRPLAQTERRTDTDEDRFFAIVTDLIGTPTELVSESGDLAWRTRATLWGTTTWNKTATAYTPLRFPGQYFDPESGLHYNYFRYYDPESAHYLTQDPLGLAPADDPSTYVHNPNTWSDPLGLSPCEDPSHDTSESRREAFRKAKQHLGIPMWQHPDEIQRVPMTDRDGNRILDDNNQFVMTREYIFTRADGSRVMIQDHAAGHYYGEGGQGDQGSHFNVRPIENTRTGHVPGTARHYDY